MAVGFGIVDGGPERAPAPPRTLLFCALLVLAAQWVVQFWSGIVTQLSFVALPIMYGAIAPTPLAVLIWNTVPFGILAAASLHLSRARDNRGPAALGLTWGAWSGALPWVVVALAAAAPAHVWLLRAAEGWQNEIGPALFVLAPAALVQASAEEILFRGVLMTCLVARYGPLTGSFFSACLFALWHIDPQQPVSDMLIRATMTFVFGLTAAVVVLRQGHLGGAIALHVIWNVSAGVVDGLSNWPAPFWESYVQRMYTTWTFLDLTDQATLTQMILPLAIETVLIALISKNTIYEIVEKRARRSATAGLH